MSLNSEEILEEKPFPLFLFKNPSRFLESYCILHNVSIEDWILDWNWKLREQKYNELSNLCNKHKKPSGLAQPRQECILLF